MERLLFGEFLVEKGLASRAAVLNSLVEQIQNQPSVARIIHQENLLSEEQQLQVLRVQSNTGWDYQQAATHLSLWTGELAAKVLAANSKYKMPLGQILVSKGIVSFSELTKALDDYVGMYENKPVQSDSGAPPDVQKATHYSNKVTVEKPKIASVAEVAATDDAKASVKVDGYLFPVIDQALLAEFLDVCAENRHQEIAEIVQSWPGKISGGDLTVWLIEVKAIAREMESIVAASRFVRAETTLNISSRCVEMLSKCLAREDKLQALSGKLFDAVKSTYLAMAHIRGFLKQDRCESGAWADDGGKILFEGAMSKCDVIIATLAE